MIKNYKQTENFILYFIFSSFTAIFKQNNILEFVVSDILYFLISLSILYFFIFNLYFYF